MITTYMMENDKGEVIGYGYRLYECKTAMEFPPTKGRIVCLKGHYFGEGYHMYYLYYDGKKWSKKKGKL